MSTLRFLLLEDKPQDTEEIQAKLTDGGIDYELLRVDTRADFVTALETQAFDLILAAYAMPGLDGIAALDIACTLCPDVPFIFVSASLGEELAIDALKRGATDYVLKQRLERLIPCVQRALREVQGRKRSEAALRRAEAKNRMLFESIDEGFCICEMLFDENGEPYDYRFLEVNPLFEAMTGLERATGKTARELVPTLEAYWFETYGSVVLTGKSLRFEQQSVPMNRWFNVNVFRIGEPQSNQFAILFTDITDRKKAEQERDRFLAIGSDLQMITSTNGYFQWVSPTFERVLGWTADEMTSRPWTDFVHPDDIGESVSEADRLFSGNEIFEFENRYRHKDGSYRWFLWRTQSYPEEQVLYGTAIDITEAKRAEIVRKRSEAALRQNESRLRAVAANLPNAAVFIVNHELRFLLAEGEALRSTGMTSGDLVGKTLWEALDPDLATYYEPYYRQALRGEPYSLEHHSHDRYYVSHGTPLRNDQGEVDAVLAVSYDITDRKRAELNAAFLATVSQTLIEATCVEEIVQTVGEQLNRYLNTSSCAFVEINEAKDEAVINHNWHQDDVPSLVGVYPLPEFVTDEFLQVAKAGQPIVIRNITTDWRIVDPQRLAPLKIGSFINVPLIRDGEWKFTLGVYHQEPYNWRTDEIDLMRELSARIWDRLERTRAEVALHDSEARLQRAIAIETVGVVFFRTDGQITDANDAFLRMSGYSREDVQQGRVCLDSQTPPEFRAASLEAINEFVATGRITPYEKEYVRKDGSRWWGLFAGQRLNDVEGVKFIIDITEAKRLENDRKQTEAALRQSEARLRLMIESAKEYAIFSLDPNGIITSWNAGAERLLGYREAEIVGCHSRIIFTPEDIERGKPEQELQIALTQGRAVNERWHVRKDGSRYWGSGLMMPLQAETDSPQGFIKIMQDKTAQRQADERFQLLYDTTSDLLATEQPMTLVHNLFSKLSAQLGLHYYCNYMVEEKDNQLMLHLMNYEGISDEAAQAIEWIEFGQHLCGQVAQERQQIVLDQAQLLTHPNAQLARSIGITAYVGQPLIVRGRLLGTLSFASHTRTDFTPEETDLLQSTCDQIAIAIERANLVQSIQQQAEQLQQANQIKDEFLAVLSHELRSPLNPILGWSKLLQQGKLDEARTKNALATIERNAQLQSQLIEDLLDISRILRGKLSLNVMPIDLSMVISAALETVRLAADAKLLHIQTTLSPHVGMVMGDAGRLQQVVWNLLSNAVKFTPQGGQITVTLTQTKTHAQLQVTDTGKGIQPDFLPHVFDYFRQEDGATTRKFGGLGLGLAIVQQIVELHGGTVTVDSPGEGLGATFTVQIPLAARSRELPAPEPSFDLTNDLSNIHVLVVDDEADSREFVVFVLEQANALVTSVSSGIEALQFIEQAIPDLVVSDIGMPDMDGYMLMQQVRSLDSLEPARQVPAIALTAYAGEFDRQQAIAAGFQQHIPKPVDPDKLLSAISALFPRSCRSGTSSRMN